MDKRIQTYQFWGVHFDKQIGLEIIAECPFCHQNDSHSGEGHFFLHATKAVFDCKYCGKQGSQRDFLRFIYEESLKTTTEEQLRQFTKKSGIPLPTLKKAKVAYKDGRYFLPVYNPTGDTVDLRHRTLTGQEYSTKGCSPSLYNLPELLNESIEKVYLCEGWKDALSLRWLLERTNNYKNTTVLSAPGSNSFRDEWGPYFERKHLIICYDHDEAGYGTFDVIKNKSTGSKKVGVRVKHYVESIQFIQWPKNSPKGFDVNDHIKKFKSKPNFGYSKLQSYITNFVKEEQPKKNKSEDNIKLDDIFHEASSIYNLEDQFVEAWKLAIATMFSVQLPGHDNVWLHLVGPPGCGKSLIIQTFRRSKRVIWESTLKRPALVSGWGIGDRNDNDPSILAKINNKGLAVKDFTTILSLPPSEINEVFGLLRDAYDGEVKVPFGKGVRHYLCNFSFISGVTHQIKLYDQTQLGERFLKYNMKDSTHPENVQEIAMQSQLKKKEQAHKIQGLVAEFLNNTYKLDQLSLEGRIPRWFKDRIKPLARLLGHLRTEVPRIEKGHRMGNVAYYPVIQGGNRESNQLQNLALALSIIENKPAIDEDIFSIIKTVALNSVDGHKTTLVKGMVRVNEPVDIETMKRMTGLSNLYFMREDLKMLEILEENGDGRYHLTNHIKDYWKRANL